MTMQPKTICRQIYQTAQATIAVGVCTLALAATAHARDIYQGTLETVFTEKGHDLTVHLCKSSSTHFKLTADPTDADSAKQLAALETLRREKSTPINLSVVGDLKIVGTPSDDNYDLSVLNYEVGGFKHCGLSSFLGAIDDIAIQEKDYKNIQAMIKKGDVTQANTQLKQWLADFDHEYATKNPNFMVAHGHTITQAETEKTRAEIRLLEIRKHIDERIAQRKLINRWQYLPYRVSNHIVKGKYRLANAQLKVAINDIGTGYVPKKGDLTYATSYVDNTPAQLEEAEKLTKKGKLRAAAIKRLAVFKIRFKLLSGK